jgi:hypothetical protein
LYLSIRSSLLLIVSISLYKMFSTLSVSMIVDLLISYNSLRIFCLTNLETESELLQLPVSYSPFTI